MVKVSVAEALVFLVLAAAGFLFMPVAFEMPVVIGTLFFLVLIAKYGWYFTRLNFSKVVVVRGLGVNVLSKDFQTTPLQPNPDAWKVINKLRNTHVTVVIWSFTEDFDISTMKHFNLYRFYDRVFYPSDFNTSEPAQYLQGICKKLGVSPKRVVLIDTDEKGMAAGHSLGMKVVPFKNPDKLESDLRSIGL